MFISFALYFIPTLVIMVATHYFMNCSYTIKEMLLQFVATVLIIFGLLAIDNSLQIGDYKTINGVVSQKEVVQRNCRQYWSTSEDSWCETHDTRVVTKTRTVTVDGKTKVETYFETEYRPRYSWERKYYVNSTIGDYKIARVDDRGSYVPPRYDIVKIGDPVSGTERYKNYVGAVSSSLFKYSDDAFPEVEIEQPKIYDYYNIDRFISDIPLQQDIRDLNKTLSAVNSSIDTGANVVVYVTDKPETFSNSLQVKWQGYKINDVVITLGVDKSTGMYQYVDVKSWSESSSVEFSIEDALRGKGLDTIKEDIVTVGQIANENFSEADPEKFSYLKYQIELSWFTTILLILISLVVTPIVTYLFCRNDVF